MLAHRSEEFFAVLKRLDWRTTKRKNIVVAIIWQFQTHSSWMNADVYFTANWNFSFNKNDKQRTFIKYKQMN